MGDSSNRAPDLMRGKKAKAIRKKASQYDLDAKALKQMAKLYYKNGPIQGLGLFAAMVDAWVRHGKVAQNRN